MSLRYTSNTVVQIITWQCSKANATSFIVRHNGPNSHHMQLLTGKSKFGLACFSGYVALLKKDFLLFVSSSFGKPLKYLSSPKSECQFISAPQNRVNLLSIVSN
ncbi:phosphatidylinositol 3-kinase regulatory subunit alpha [Platysternon megacephalum]|uniref:Phosphatidylinositol 3-kinase regulatory subunit alpha n=1 Tax=Platysternon megacephalum TaxID=55544 RepID=A0A4D9EYA4_9SAUR|nr:phosphatidylinositol 3-kinase regulatory subunit alpha [Platysternon megacephalum]